MRYVIEGPVYDFDHVDDFVSQLVDIKIVKSGSVEYYNCPCSFDIETSNYEVDDKKYATMYIWQFGINGHVVYGRTWEEFGSLLEKIENKLNLDDNKRLIIFVHNLSFEFQFIKGYFQWDKVFAIKSRRPVYAICGGFEFRCSYFLSNYALKYIGDQILTKYKVRKLTGDLDYDKVRHSDTPLTDKELQYCINDVYVVMAYIQEKIEAEDNGLASLPLTNTGFVRRYVRDYCFTGGEIDKVEAKKNLLDYKALMKSLRISGADEYKQLKRAFAGGFTHAGNFYSGQLMEYVGSADLTSSYPAVMCADYFPMSSAVFIGTIDNKQLLEMYLNKYCCIFDIQFNNIRSRPGMEFEHYLMDYKCIKSGKTLIDNGRIASCSGSLITTMTELDFDIVSRFYVWDSIRVFNMRLYTRGYLPRPLIMSILKLYGDKTTLKGIDGKEIEYLVSKNMINSTFGMTVTDIVRDMFIYDNQTFSWLTSSPDMEQAIAIYNKNYNRFLFYPWGIYVTAHARHNLFSAIAEFKNDYIYADTDSIKGINFQNHEDYFVEYNENITKKLFMMCQHYNIPFELTKPKTNKGVEKPLGVWDIEKGYRYFKTIGAKRYMYVHEDNDINNGEFNLTVSGLNKKLTTPYLIYNFALNAEEKIKCDDMAISWLYDHPELERGNEDNIKPFIKFMRRAYEGNKEAMSILVDMQLQYLGCFAIFDDGMYVPEDATGCLSATYVDEEFEHDIVDYLGQIKHCYEMSAVNLKAHDVIMSKTIEYINFLKGVQHVEY